MEKMKGKQPAGTFPEIPKPVGNVPSPVKEKLNIKSTTQTASSSDQLNKVGNTVDNDEIEVEGIYNIFTGDSKSIILSERSGLEE